MTPSQHLALLDLLTGQYDSRDEAADAILDTALTVLTPEAFGKAVGGLVKLPEPWESWDDQAAAWAYSLIMDLLKSVDFNRDPDAIGDRAWRKAQGLSVREANAAGYLLELTEGDVRGRAAVNRLVSLNAREMKRRDPVWLLKQALKHIDNSEAAASVTRALAFLEA